MSGGHNPARLASILAQFGGVADEIVVAVEEPRAIATHVAVSHVADRVLSFPPTAPSDRPISWLFGACSGTWILNIDDDEVPSPRLIELLPEILARRDITHGWIARRWLYPGTDTYLVEAPWGTEFQLRLFLVDSRFVQFSDEFHRPVVAHGPGLFIDAPLWHLDTATNSVERRGAKADAYELERPGMKISGRAHNHALYVPELASDPIVVAVPGADQAVIVAAVAGELVATRQTPATLTHAAVAEVDRTWPGEPYSPTLHSGRITCATAHTSMRAGVQETIDAYVTNESEEIWRWGKEARPEIRLGYRWSLNGIPVREPRLLRTPFPADLHPGETQFVPVHVVPPDKPGRYALQLEIVHEGFGSFGSSQPFELEVRKRQVVAVVGAPASVGAALVLLAPSPEVEPIVVLGNDSDRSTYGDYACVSGLRASLLDGLEGAGRLSRGLRLLWRSLGLIREARRYRRTGVTHDVRLVGLFDLLASSESVIVAGPDWAPDAAAGREWWRLVTTILVGRAIGRPVLVSDEAVPRGSGGQNVTCRRLIGWFGTPLASVPPEIPSAGP